MSATVISCNEEWKEQEYDKSNIEKLTRSYIVKISEPCPSGTILATTASNCPDTIPTYGQPFELSSVLSGMTVQNINAKPLSQSDRLHYKVLATYSTKQINVFNTTKYPWDEDAVISYSTVTRDDVVNVDYSSPAKKFVNAAGDLISGIKRTYDNMLVNIEVAIKKSEFDGVTSWFEYSNTVNSGNITIAGLTIPKEAAKINDIKINRKTYKMSYGDVTYYDCLFSFEVSNRYGDGTLIPANEFIGHKLYVLNAGFHERKQGTAVGDGIRVRIKVEDPDTGKLVPCASPYPLDETGYKLNTAYGSGGNPFFLKFTLYPSKDWTTIVNLINNRTE